MRTRILAKPPSTFTKVFNISDANTCGEVSIEVNDILDEIINENKELKYQIKIFNQFKDFFDRICSKLRFHLSEQELNELKKLNKLLIQFEVFKNDKLVMFAYEPEPIVKVEKQESKDENCGQNPEKINPSRGCKGKSYRHFYVKPINYNPPKPKPKPKEYVCDYQNCGQVFNMRKFLDNHRRKKHGIGYPSTRTVWRCEWPGCDYFTIRCRQYEEHMNEHQGIRYKCPIDGCTKTYKTHDSLKFHSECSHSGKPYKCTENGCKKSFRSEKCLLSHKKRVHIERERTAVCDVEGCDFRTYNTHSIELHKLNVHSDLRPFMCSICGKQYKIKGQLAIHESAVHGFNTIVYKCEEEGCNQQFRYHSGLRRHRARSHSSEFFHCDWPGCDYSSKFKYALKKHGYVHKDRDFLCQWPECGKSFKCPKYLNEHIRGIHKKDKRFACSWPGCQYRCYQRSNVSKHERLVHKMKRQDATNI